jgi:hypothetical protein
MKPITIATFAVVVLACSVPAGLAAHAQSPAPNGPALGKVSGSCTFDKTHTVTFVDGVALQGHLFFKDKEPATLVRVSNLMLGGFRPDLFLDPSAELDGMSSGPKNAYNIITLSIDKTGDLEGLGPSGSLRTGDWTFTGGTVKNGRVSGTVSGTGGATGGDTCRITFDVPFVGDYGVGKPLPADGGEPGQAMRSLWTSVKNEDSAATVAVLGESLVAPAQHGTMPQFVTVFGGGGGRSSDRVVGGKLYGAGRAVLDLDLVGGRKARALVLKQGDRWRVQDVSFY